MNLISHGMQMDCREYLMSTKLSGHMVLYLVSRGSRLYFGQCAGGRRTEFFNMQCILWRQRDERRIR